MSTMRLKLNYSLIGKTIMYAFLLLMFIFTLYPILYVIFGSFKTNHELVKGGLSLLPSVATVQNYVEAWKLANFAQYTFNSIYMSTAVMVITLFIASMAGYCFARKEFFAKNLIYGLLIAFMFINVGSVSLRPLFELAVKVNMHTSLWAIIFICIGTGQATFIFLIRGYMNTIPISLEEAARIDGCTFFGTYWRVVLPLLKPVLATIALLSFKRSWNEYVLPLIFSMTKPEIRPLTVGVVSLRNVSDGAAAWNIMFAGASMSIVPIIIIYIFLSRYFITGLTNGAVKG